MAKTWNSDTLCHPLRLPEEFTYNSLPLLLELRDYDRIIDRAHEHANFYEFAIVLSGTAKSCSPDGELHLSHGDVMIFAPGTRHHYHSIRKFRHYNFLFSPVLLNCGLSGTQLLPRELELPGYGKTELLHLGEPELLESVVRLESMAKEFYNYIPGRESAICAEFARTLLYILRHALPDQEERNNGAYQIGRVLLHINKNASANFTLEDLAAYAGMSVSSFRHRFREHTGISPKEYTIRLKLRQAALILTGQYSNITQAAVAAGFSDGNYFARCFRQTFGMTPRAFRKAWNENQIQLEQLLDLLPGNNLIQ